MEEKKEWKLTVQSKNSHKTMNFGNQFFFRSMKLILYIISLQVCVKNPNGISFIKIRSLSEWLFKRFKYPRLSQAKVRFIKN